MKRLINHVDAGKSLESFQPSLLDAVQIVKQSWDNVEPTTIYYCFKKAGFAHSSNECTPPIDETDGVDTASESTTVRVSLLEQLFNEYGITRSVETPLK